MIRCTLLLWCLSLFLGGCASPGPQPPTDQFLVSVPKSQFYKYGPAQAFGADFNLEKGQKVTMLKREFGYSRIQLADGQTGYVATEELTPAPPEPPPPRATPPPKLATRGTGAGASSKPRRSNVQPVAEDPLFDITDIPLPMPQDPAPTPAKPTP